MVEAMLLREMTTQFSVIIILRKEYQYIVYFN